MKTDFVTSFCEAVMLAKEEARPHAPVSAIGALGIGDRGAISVGADLRTASNG